MGRRLRIRGGGRGGKIAAGSIATAVVGAVVKDLTRPNSFIRGLIATGREKLLAWRQTRPSIDISDKVQVKYTSDHQNIADKLDNEDHKKEI
jgi:hypothetical protein